MDYEEVEPKEVSKGGDGDKAATPKGEGGGCNKMCVALLVIVVLGAIGVGGYFLYVEIAKAKQPEMENKGLTKGPLVYRGASNKPISYFKFSHLRGKTAGWGWDQLSDEPIQGASESSKNTIFKQCGSTGVKTVNVEPCNSQPCKFKEGGKSTITVEFKADHAAKTVNAFIHAIIKGVAIPWALKKPQNAPCDKSANSRLKCPIAKGSMQTYKMTIELPSGVPAIETIVKWELKDENGKDLICFEAPVYLVV